MIKCEICGKEYKNFMSLGIHISKGHKIKSEEYYLKYISSIGKCKLCGKNTTYINMSTGYRQYCSRPCLQNDPVMKVIKQETYFKKTGYYNPGSDPAVQEKRKATNLEKTGFENPFSNPKIQIQIKNTNLEKTGFENPMQNPITKQKASDTYYARTGYRNPLENPVVQEKSKNTYYEKTGYEYSGQDPVVREKASDTYYSRTGYTQPFLNPVVQEKAKNTYYEKSGYVNPFLNPVVQDYISDFNIDKYGVKSSLDSKEVKHKLTVLNRNKALQRIVKRQHNYKVEFIDQKYINLYHPHNWKCSICHKRFKIAFNSIKVGYKCPYCFPRNSGVSMQEKEVLFFIKSLIPDFEIHENTRTIIQPQELDIYIPKLNLAIEYNGDYWHSEEKVGKNYHENKTLKCKELGIELIHISENSWVNDNENIQLLLSTIIDSIKKELQ
jgi:hypothetical protein